MSQTWILIILSGWAFIATIWAAAATLHAVVSHRALVKLIDLYVRIQQSLLSIASLLDLLKQMINRDREGLQ